MASKPTIEFAVLSHVSNAHACVLTPMKAGRFRVDVSANVDIEQTGYVLAEVKTVVDNFRGAGSIPEVTIHGAYFDGKETRALSRPELAEIGLNARVKELEEEVSTLERISHERDCWKDIATFMMALADPECTPEHWRRLDLAPMEITETWLNDEAVQKHVRSWWRVQVLKAVAGGGLASIECIRCCNKLKKCDGDITYCETCDRYAGPDGLSCCDTWCPKCIAAETKNMLMVVGRDFVGRPNTEWVRAELHATFCKALAERLRIPIQTSLIQIDTSGDTFKVKANFALLAQSMRTGQVVFP